MPLLDALLLGLLQGLTEFLPVSSDGHLALGALVMGHDPSESGGIFYDLLLHLATMMAVLVHFRRELWSLRHAVGSGPGAGLARRTCLLVIAASIPTAIVGLTLKDACERAFGVPVLVGLGFLATSAVLTATILMLRRRAARAGSLAPGESASEPAKPEIRGLPDWSDVATLRVRDAVVVGALQGLAPWPGFSRSGVTIAGGVAMGVAPVTAARFSLLISLPAIGGAFLLKLREVETFPTGFVALASGFVVAGVVGYFAIGWLIAIARHARLGIFAAYTFILGLVTIALALAR